MPTDREAYGIPEVTTTSGYRLDFTMGAVEPCDMAEPPASYTHTWPKLLWVCDHCGHWHGASYSTWTMDGPPNCKIKGYGRDGKTACGRPMRAVQVVPVASGVEPVVRVSVLRAWIEEQRRAADLWPTLKPTPQGSRARVLTSLSSFLDGLDATGGDR